MIRMLRFFRVMKSFFPPAAGLALLLWTAAAPALALPSQLPSRKDSWIELRTADFTLYSDAGEGRTRAVGEDLERLHDALAQLSPGLLLASPFPTYVYVFKDAAAFQPYQKTYGGQPVNAGGYFLGRQLAGYIAINASLRGGDPHAIVYHEYIHSVLRNHFASLPLWLNEGLAEYYSTFQASGDEARIGLPVSDHVAWLRDNALIPLATLFAVEECSPEYNESSRRGGFYAESWALVHYLISGSPERRRQTLEYLRLAQAGTPPERLFAEAFGTGPAPLAGLENELRLYIRKYLFAFTRVPLRPAASGPAQVRALAGPDLLFRLGDLLANLGDDHAAAAAESFHAALAVQPDHAPALAGLGQLEARAGNADAAHADYEKAAHLAPDDFAVQYLYADDLLASPTAESLLQARAALGRVVALRPDFGEAWASLGYTYQSEENLTPAAVQALETAHKLLPARMDVAHNLAVAYARTGQPQQAGELIDHVLVPGGASPEEVESAREAVIDEEQQRAEELIDHDELAAAAALLEEVRAKTGRPERREAVARRLDEIHHTQGSQAFLARYNQAVDLANHGDVKGAVAVLEPLLTTTEDPLQVEQARALLARLQPPRRKGAASRWHDS
jgi:tetratricopeptide (TPR) repeat protein